MEPFGIKPFCSVSRRSLLAATVGASLSSASWARVVGANDRVRVGFIGLGLIGKRHLLDFQREKNAELVAVAETHSARRDEALGLLGSSARGYRDFRELLDRQDIDAVVVSTPDHWHALPTMAACAAGKDVYVEKPLSLFVREGRWMVDCATHHKRIVQVGTQQRSGPHYQRAKELINNGYLGKISSVRLCSYRNISPGFATHPDQPPPEELDWQFWLGPAPDRPYNPGRAIYHFRWFWDTSGGQMTNLAAHSIDLVHWILGLDAPTAVASTGGRYCLTGLGETPDTQDAFFEYPGLSVVWSHREASVGRKEQPYVEFAGTHGCLSLSRKALIVDPDPKLPPECFIPSFGEDQPVGGPRSLPLPENPSYRCERIVDRTGSERDQFRRHVRDFLDCVKSRQTPRSDLESAHRVATACHLANLSLRFGRKLRWDPKREEILDDPLASAALERPYRAPWDKLLASLRV